ncbi:MAG: MaoC family dehydratase N-terminal domain-containing protein [Halioglobus sp.]
MSLVNPLDYDVKTVCEQWKGRLVGDSKGRFPVEYDPIRRHCHMLGDLNPAFLDPEIANAGPHGSVVVPPSMLPTYFASGGPWPLPELPNTDSDRPIFTFGVPTPGDRGINMEVEWLFPEPIRIGDQLRMELRIADVFIKPIKLDDHAVWIVSESSFFNQHERVVAVWRNTVLVHRSPEQVEAHNKEKEQREASGGVQ